MHDFIIEAIARGGYLGIFFLMALENVFPPIPSEVIMGIGGVLVAQGRMDFWPLLLIGTLGTVAGNWVWYWIGDHWGYERTRPFIDRWGRWLTIEWHHMEAATRFFHRRGQWVVFFLRFSPLMRTIISLPAGLAHMPLWKFLAMTFAGSAIWNAVLILGGQMLAGYIDEYKTVFGWVIAGLIALAVIGYIWRVLTWKPRAEREV